MNERENKNMGFLREIIGCLTSPRSSFRSILENPSLMKAIVIILLIAILAALATFNYMSKLPLTSFPGQGTPVNPEQFHQVWGTISAMTALIGVFGTWLISSVLIHGFSRTLGIEDAFRSMLTLAGYASAPLLLQQLFRLADSFTVSQEQVLQLAADLQISTYPLLNTIAEAAIDIFTIFRLWSMALLIVAARENYKISTIRSTVAATLSFITLVLVSAFLPIPIT